MTTCPACLLGCLLLASAAVAQTVPTSPGAPSPRQSSDATVKFKRPSSLEIGDKLRVDFGVKLQVDFRQFSPELLADDDRTTFRRARVGVKGRAVRDVEFELEYDFRESDHPWRDAFVNFRRYRGAEVQGGRFKVPFGREQNTGVFNIDFLRRALISADLAPARDVGGMVHGRLGGGAVEYQTGVFQHDGDNARFDDNPGANASGAGRVLWSPWSGHRGLLHDVRGGVAVMTGSVPEGLNSLRGRTISGFVFFEPVYVRGRRARLGLEGTWLAGPCSLQAEYMRVQDQRLGQGVEDNDLPDVVGEGWYVAATWAITGERKDGWVEPRHPFARGGAGALEVAARFESERFGSISTGGEEAYSNPRAANLLENQDRVLTLGLNWYLNQFGRVVVNTTREEIRDPERSPIVGRTRFWGISVGLQFKL